MDDKIANGNATSGNVFMSTLSPGFPVWTMLALGVTLRGTNQERSTETPNK
jgi:hypothetical protein